MESLDPERPLRLHRTTGLHPEQLDELVALCFQHQDTQDSATGKRAGRPAALSFYRAIAVTVAYIRQNIVQEVLAEIFDTSQSSISRAITAMTPVIAAALQVCVPDLAEAIRGEVTLVDGSLLPCWSWRKHPELYSGKHHTTGHNVQVVASLEGRVLHISDPLPGRRTTSRHYVSTVSTRHSTCPTRSQTRVIKDYPTRLRPSRNCQETNSTITTAP